MSEKKTAEIKLRIEPSRKARYQQAAADEGVGLSEWLVKAADDSLRGTTAKIKATDVVVDFATLSSSPVATDEVPTKDRDSDWSGDWKPWGGKAA